MNFANLSVKRPELCKQCLMGKSCTRGSVRGGVSCKVVRDLYDAGFHSALTKIANAVDAARQHKLERKPAAPVKRRRRRRANGSTATILPEPSE